MKLGHLELFVTNPPQSAVFYQDVLGFERVVRQSDELIWLKSGEVELLLRKGQPAQRPETYQSTAIALVLYTDNLPQMEDDLRARGLVFAGTDGSDRCLTFSDPDGNWFQLVNPNEH